MDVLEILASVASLTVGPLLIIVPLLLFRWGTDTAAYCEPYGHRRVNNATLAGAILGVCLVIATPLPGQPLRFASVFGAGGPWDLRLHEFGALVLDRFAAAPRFLFERLAEDDERLNLTLGVGVAAGLVLRRVVWDAIRRHGWRFSLLALALDLFLAGLTASLTFYGALLGLWLCNRLNFWLIALAILLIQEYRYNVVGLYPKHRHFRLPRAALPLGAPVRAKATRRR